MMSTQNEQADTGETKGPEGVSDRVASAYAAARARAGETVEGVASTLTGNPLATLIGGIAIGAAVGALIPRSEREKALLAPLGARIGDAARAALDAAKDTGKQSFADAGLSTDQLRQQVNTLVEQALAAAGEAGTAAIAAARETATR
jgi:hypothetical protein